MKVEEQRLDLLLQLLSEKLDWTLEFDKESLAKKGVSPDVRVSFEIKNATVAQLFESILRPLKLHFSLKKNSLRVW
jgi:hypothetical protein